MPPPPPPPNPRGEEGRAKRKGGERGEEGRGEGKRASACRGEEGGRGTPTPTPPDAGRRGRGAGCRKGRSAARMHVCACVRGTVRKEGCVCVCVRGTVRKEGCVCVCAWGVNDWPGVGWARRRPAPRCWPSTAARRRPCRHRGASYPNPAPPHVQQAPLPPLGSAQRELLRGEGRRRVARVVGFCTCSGTPGGGSASPLPSRADASLLVLTAVAVLCVKVASAK